jgi:hypothetical protein
MTVAAVSTTQFESSDVTGSVPSRLMPLPPLGVL